jgi:hypothetical protein
MIDNKKRTPLFSKKRGLAKMSRRRNSASDTSSLSSSYSARRSVCFSEYDAVRCIPAISDMSKKEIRDVWYNDAEFQNMKQGCARVLREVITGNYKHDIDGIVSEARGLENKTREGSDARKLNREIALSVVLNEQHRQRKYFVASDPEKIAKVYHFKSSHCQAKALEMAAHDARLIHGEEHHETRRSRKAQPPASLSPTPSVVACSSMISPHDETLSHRRIISMMSPKQLPQSLSYASAA